MVFSIRQSSSYMPVSDMKRAVRFYQKLFGRKVNVKDENLSVFDFGDWKFCLKKADKEVDGENNHLLSFELADKDEFFEKTRMQFNKRNMVGSELVRLSGWVLKTKDSEGNDVNIYWNS